jgi:hypothetical protein
VPAYNAKSFLQVAKAEQMAMHHGNLAIADFQLTLNARRLRHDRYPSLYSSATSRRLISLFSKNIYLVSLQQVLTLNLSTSPLIEG